MRFLYYFQENHVIARSKIIKKILVNLKLYIFHPLLSQFFIVEFYQSLFLFKYASIDQF